MRSFERVNVFYPRGTVTGGPEALHQLVDALRNQGVDAALCPLPGTEGESRATEYERYDAPERPHQPKARETALVFPEIFKGGFLTRQPAWCWWLSVDDSALWRASRRWRTGQDSTLRSKAWTLAHRVRDRQGRYALRRKINAVEHVTQSAYAWAFVLEHHDPMPSMLSDYVSVPVESRVPKASARPVIAFNPIKGGHHVRELQKMLPSGSVNWLALTGMDRDEVRRALLRAHVYLDLGHHPGKDRLPREAAACGAIVTLLRTGSAAYSADAPIPGEHKIDPTGNIPSHASEVLTRLLADVGHHHSLQAPYREHIRSERKRFDREVRAVFVEGRRGFDDIDVEVGRRQPLERNT